MTTNLLCIRITAAAAILTAFQTNGAETPQLPAPSSKQGVTYEKDVRPIFEKACFECHGDEKHEGELRLNSLSEIQYGGEEGAILEPGDSAKSSIVLAVARVNKKTAMPPERKPGKDIGPDGKKLPPIKKLTAEEIGLIRAWIDQGAN